MRANETKLLSLQSSKEKYRINYKTTKRNLLCKVTPSSACTALIIRHFTI